MLLMRNVLLISCLLAGVAVMGVHAQAPATPAQQKPAPAPAPAPTTQKPATGAPATQTRHDTRSTPRAGNVHAIGHGHHRD